jgi:hypothetical protein
MSAEDRELWLVDTVSHKPLKKLFFASFTDMANRNNRIYLKWGDDWFKLEKDPLIKDEPNKNLAPDEGMCSYCGRPSNSTDCQRSHP